MNSALERRTFLLRQGVLRPGVDLSLAKTEIDNQTTAHYILSALGPFINPDAPSFFLRAVHRNKWQPISTDNLIDPISEFVAQKIAVYNALSGYCKMIDSARLLIYKSVRKSSMLWLADFAITGYERLGSGQAVYYDGKWSFTQTPRHSTETAHLYLKQTQS